MKEQDELILDLVFEDNIPKTRYLVLYRYLNDYGYIKTTAHADYLEMRLSHPCEFEDKTEGKIIKEYYSIALNELLNEKIISIKQYDNFRALDVDEILLIIDRRFDPYECYDVERTPYIICLSKNKEDPELYGIEITHCLELCGIDEYNFIDNDFIRTRILSIQYGTQAITLIKNRIKKYLCVNSRDICESFIKDVLSDLQYICKEDKYRYENEVRVVLYLDLKHFYNNNKYILEEDKRHLIVRLPRELLVNEYIKR